MDHRRQWVEALVKIGHPVLDALANRRLKETLPTAFHSDRAIAAPLEALGRLMCGLAPWLEATGLSAEEETLRARSAGLALEAFDAATDPASPDRMCFTEEGGYQPLVDAAFLAQALARAPDALAGKLPPRVKQNLIGALKQTRTIPPHPNNWLYFSAMVEAGLFMLEGTCDMAPVWRALDTFVDWYKGDGLYGDGPQFHFDYYNSFVIHPMQLDLLRVFAHEPHAAALRGSALSRASRYAAILERMIAPDGTYPLIGRSLTYRFGAFQLLSQAALEGFLPQDIAPAQVRCALSAVLTRTLSAPGMFDPNGWLTPGVYGCQPGLAEGYISVGSLYLCASVFLPLGLSPNAPFWHDADAPWTAVKGWSGVDMQADHALHD